MAPVHAITLRGEFIVLGGGHEDAAASVWRTVCRSCRSRVRPRGTELSATKRNHSQPKKLEESISDVQAEIVAVPFQELI